MNHHDPHTAGSSPQADSAGSFLKKTGTFFKRWAGPNFGLRFILMTSGVVLMGVFLSILVELPYGTDTWTFMCYPIAQKLGWKLGTVELLFQLLLLIPMLIFGPNLLGIGSLFNMSLIGYIIDLCGWIWDKIIPASWFTTMPAKLILFIIAITGFLIAVALYINADLGLAPVDAPPVIISRKFKKIPYYVVRMIEDGLIITVGLIMGNHLRPTTVVLLFTLGPSTSAIARWLAIHFPKLKPNGEEI